ncbi:MAG: ABC transporter ATP-binding protein [Candidatus Sericytochromatia bacterium]|nr:ABC transporter ATP-binding protein [Candidatus Sericytochromatia bacterium]
MAVTATTDIGSVEVRGVWKEYALASQRPRTLKEAVVEALRGRLPERPRTWALQDVGFRIEPGESFGIIGTNGSGKSTLLKLLTGISKPTRGTVDVHGKVSALLELGAGFHPDFSGRENTFLNGAILGLSRKEVAERYDRIVAFAELADHIDQPVKTYSSGMYMRLAFSIAVHVEPEILIIDEVLAVGDAAFQKKCIERIRGFRREGRTIIFVSHSHGQVAELCSRAAWIDSGVLRAVGPCEDVLAQYEAHLAGTGV